MEEEEEEEEEEKGHLKVISILCRKFSDV